MTKTYVELISLSSFEERFNYLKLDGRIGEETFGWDRYLNQFLYSSKEWKRLRRKAILRDCVNGGNCCDMALEGYDIFGKIIVHHINPITKEMILNRDPALFDLNNVICVSEITHKAIHYGEIDICKNDLIIRSPNDTCPWKR